MRLDPQEGERWTVRHLPFASPPVVLAASLLLDYAQGLSEDFIRQQGAVVLADRHAPWRRDPATDKQVATLVKLRLPHTPTISKGEASEFIASRLGGRQ